MTDNLRQNTVRDTQGRFTNGNPGRPLGAKNKTPKAVLKQIQAMEQAAVQKLWEAVWSGERWAVEFVLSKILPSQRTIEMENLSARDVKQALQDGDITPEEARTMTLALKPLMELENFELLQERRIR